MNNVDVLDIVIPVYKEQGWLADLLDGLLGQCLAGVQVYISVSCGADESEFTALGHQYLMAQNLTVIQAPIGVSCARNSGAAAGSSDWILFLDSDVLLPDFFLDSLRRILQMQPSDALGFSFYADSFRPLMRVGVRVSYGYLCILNALRMPVLPGFALLVQRGAFQEVGGFRNGLAIGEDFAFTEDLRRRGFSVSLTSFPWVAFSVRRFEVSLWAAARILGQYLRVEVVRLLFHRKYLEGDMRYDFGEHIRLRKRRFPGHIKAKRRFT